MKLRDRVVKINDSFLRALETDTRPAVITQDGSITRVDFRSRVWLVFVYAGAIFLVSLLSGLIVALFKQGSFTNSVTKLWPEAFLALLLLAVSALTYFTKQGLQISETEVIVEGGVLPFLRLTKIPIATIRSVRTGSFYADVVGLAGEDRYVALETDRRTYRVAWGLATEQCEAVAEAVRKRTTRLPNSA